MFFALFCFTVSGSGVLFYSEQQRYQRNARGDTVRRVTEKSQRKARELAFREICFVASLLATTTSQLISSQAISRTSSPPYPSLRAQRGNLSKSLLHTLMFSDSLVQSCIFSLLPLAFPLFLCVKPFPIPSCVPSLYSLYSC